MNERNPAPIIAVVIPFFQREPGLLRQCVESIFAQSVLENLLVLVVDDGSPISADDELAHLGSKEKDRLHLIRQSNAGPGAARNTGLDNVPPGTNYVTFLDSDDRWTADFLTDAVSALEQGYDIFIGNSERVGQHATRFEWNANDRWNINAGEHPLVDADRGIHEFVGDFFELLVYRSNIIGPTTFAYRYEAMRALRFNPGIFNGQDRLFKLGLGQHLKRVAFSPKIYAYEGKGVNIFDKSQWGSPGSVRLSASYIKLAKCILDEIDLTPEQEAHVRRNLVGSRKIFAANVLHMIRARKPLDWRRVLQTFREDPVSALMFVPNAVHVVIQRFKHDGAKAHN